MDSISGSAAQSLSRVSIRLGDRIATSVMKMEQDQQKADGDAAVRLMEAAGQVQAREPGEGTQVDVTG